MDMVLSTVSTATTGFTQYGAVRGIRPLIGGRISCLPVD